MIKLPKTFKIKDNIYNINKISVLQNFNKEHFNKEPYPYLVIKDCLPEDIYEHLENNYRSDQDIFNLDLKKIENKMKEIVDRNDLTKREVWKRSEAIKHTDRRLLTLAHGPVL